MLISTNRPEMPPGELTRSRMILALLVIAYSIVRLKRCHENFQFIIRMVKFFRVKEFLGLEYFIEGEEILNAVESPRIFVSNHQSSLDMLGMGLIWPRRTTALVKRSLRFVPVFGLAAWLSKTVFIDRVKKEKARTVMEKTIKQIKDDQLSLWIFPEGTRNHEGSMLPFKKGAFHLAVNAQIPIVPIVFSPYTFYDKDSGKFNAGSVKITVIEPISTEGLTSEHINDLLKRVRDKMIKVYDRGMTSSDHHSCKRIS